MWGEAPPPQKEEGEGPKPVMCAVNVYIEVGVGCFTVV